MPRLILQIGATRDWIDHDNFGQCRMGQGQKPRAGSVLDKVEKTVADITRPHLDRILFRHQSAGHLQNALPAFSR